MESLIKCVLDRFLKSEILQEKMIEDLKLLDLEGINNHLSFEDIEIGNETRKVTMKLKSQFQKNAVNDMRAFFKELSSHLMNKLPITAFLKYC